MQHLHRLTSVYIQLHPQILEVMTKRDIPVPSTLVDLIKEKMKKGTGRLEEKLISRMNLFIDILRKEKIIDEGVRFIGEVESNIQANEKSYWEKIKGNIRVGGFTKDIVRNPLMIRPYRGDLDVIKADMIAAFGDDWRTVYDEYYTLEGDLKEEFNSGLAQKTSTHMKKHSSSIVTIGNQNILLNKFDDTPFISFDASKFNILILPFYNPEDFTATHPVGKDLKMRIIESSGFDESILDVEYLPYDVFDYTTQMAKKIGGEVKNTDLVIWGADSKFGNLSHHIYFHYVTLFDGSKTNFIQPKGKTEEIEIQGLIEITKGELHLEIEDVIYWFLANKFHNDGDYENALRNLEKISNEKFQNDSLYFSIALCYLYLRNYIKSEAYFKKGFELNTDDPLWNFNYGALLLLNNDAKAASVYVKRAMDLEPNCTQWIVHYAQILAELDNMEEADKYFKIALTLEQDNWEIFNSYAYFQYYMIWDIEGAKKHYEEALKINPNDDSVNFDYANILFFEFGKAEESKILYEKVLEITDSETRKKVCSANIISILGDNEGANKIYEDALEIYPHDGELNKIYSIFLDVELHDIEKSKKYLDITMNIPHGIQSHKPSDSRR